MPSRQRRADHVGEHRTAYSKNRDRLFKTGGVCGICGKPVDCSIKNLLDPMAPTVDHIIPIALGGHPSDISNLQLAHRWCNRMKADKLIDRSSLFRAAENSEIKNDVLPLHMAWQNYRPAP